MRTLFFVELFSGTGSFGRAARREARRFGLQFKLLSLDIHPRYHPTHCVDILQWDYKDALRDFLPPEEKRKDHIVWVHASPPCGAYSYTRAYRGAREFSQADAIVKRALRIIRHARPDFWTLENPKGYLRKRPFMRRLHMFEHLTSYCHFGSNFRKDTNIWTNVPVALPVCRAGTYCAHKSQHGAHARQAQVFSRLPRSQVDVTQSPLLRTDELYAIPPRLCTTLLRVALRA